MQFSPAMIPRSNNVTFLRTNWQSGINSKDIYMCIDNFRCCIQKCKWINELLKGFWGHREWLFLYSRLSVFLFLVLCFSLLLYFFRGQYIYFRCCIQGSKRIKMFLIWWGHRKKLLPYSRRWMSFFPSFSPFDSHYISSEENTREIQAGSTSITV